MSQYKITLSVLDKHTGEITSMAVSSADFPIFDSRFVGEVKAGLAFTGSVSPMKSVTAVIKKRVFRKEALIRAARQLALRLSDHFDDREGWNGEDRRDRIAALANTK